MTLWNPKNEPSGDIYDLSRVLLSGAGALSPSGFVVSWSGGTEGAEYKHLIRVSNPNVPTMGAYAASKTLPLRLISHAIVDRMPDSGVSEALESLLSLYSFYWNRRARPPALTEFAPHQSPIQAHVSAVVERPQFHVEVDSE